MKDINIRDLRKSFLHYFDYPPVVTGILEKTSVGAEKAEDFEEVLKHDKFLTEKIVYKAVELLKNNAPRSLAHAIVIVGHETVRAMVLGHCLERMFSKEADTTFVSFEEATKKASYSRLAEYHAKRNGCEYSGHALACGFMFDVFREIITRDTSLSEKFSPVLEEAWAHGVATSSLAWGLATHPKVLIAHRKLVFSLGLIHDIGRLGLAISNSDKYPETIEKIKSEKAKHFDDDGYEVDIEIETIGLTHCETGSAILHETKFLSDMELEVDFHHDITLLKLRNPDAFLGGLVMNLADRLAILFERKGTAAGQPEISAILEPHSKFFPLVIEDLTALTTLIKAKGLLQVSQ